MSQHANGNLHDLCRDNIKHVVVLMMENRSFDQLLGDFKSIDSSCDGIDRAHPNSNQFHDPENKISTEVYQSPIIGEKYDLMLDKYDFDPKHELINTIQQIGGLENPDMSGFANSTINNRSDPRYDLWIEKISASDKAKKIAEMVMQYIEFKEDPDADPLPAIQGLARRFTVCDRWFSSLPGPTWPNRFFSMMGSAHGCVMMPTEFSPRDVVTAFTAPSKQLCEESIFSLLSSAGKIGRVYSQGALPLALMAKLTEGIHTIEDFECDAKNNILPEYSWIEPGYGLAGSLNNSQHPPADLRRGDQFIARIFNALLSNKETFNSTLFVLLYDEHGGFYDHVPPPKTVAPDGHIGNDSQSFDFSRLGVRVPAILASPWIKRTIDHAGCLGPSPEDVNYYDHTSLLAFVCDLFDLDKKKLGRRVEQVRHFGNAPIWENRVVEFGDLNSFKLNTAILQKSKALEFPYETGLAAEHRYFVEVMHAYVAGARLDEILPNPPGPVLPETLATLTSVERLSDMAQQIRCQLRVADQPANKSSLTFVDAPGLGTPLRLLWVPGIGFGKDQDTCQTDWNKIIQEQFAELGVSSGSIAIETFLYDKLFENGPTMAQTLRGLHALLEDDRSSQDSTGQHQPAGILLQSTAGLVVQWIEDLQLREKLSSALIDRIRAFNPHGIFAHSLGSLIAYDALRRAVVTGNQELEVINDRTLITFGSPIAHPFVIREAWAGQISPLTTTQGGLSRWFHLYNPDDRVFTKPITGHDPSREVVKTLFNIPWPNDWFDINHSGAYYLAAPATRRTAYQWLIERNRGLTLNGGYSTAPAMIRSLAPARKRALLVGINEYPDASMHLNGCVNDVYLISRHLQESGYRAEDIRLLVDSRATRSAMLERLEWLVEGVRENDQRVFFYSGHGAQIPSYGASGEPDRMDETLVPWNFSWDDPLTHFTDKDFHTFYSALPFGEGLDPALTVIFDCCHAGGMSRGGAKIRGISPPQDIRHRMMRWDEREENWAPRYYLEKLGWTKKDGLGIDENRKGLHPGRLAQGMASELRIANIRRGQQLRSVLGHKGPYMPLMLYAAGEDELAGEYDAGAASYGAFTYALVEQLNRLRKAPNGKVPDVRSLIQMRVSEILRRRHYAQNPMVVGPKTAVRGALPWLSKKIDLRDR